MKTLLIVDDDPTIREVFSLILSSQGYTVHCADGGVSCIETLKSITPDLVLLDIMMHPVDGWETLTTIRNNPYTGQVPAIMFSGKTPSREEVINYGGWIHDYLMKPITMPIVSHALNDVFHRCNADAETRQYHMKNGTDPRIIDEYLQLRRFLFIRNKFSRELFRDSESTGYGPIPQKARFDELSSQLAIPGMNVSSEPENTAGI